MFNLLEIFHMWLNLLVFVCLRFDVRVIGVHPLQEFCDASIAQSAASPKK